MNKVFTATYQLITINSAAPHECARPIRTAGTHGGPLGSPWGGYIGLNTLRSGSRAVYVTWAGVHANVSDGAVDMVHGKAPDAAERTAQGRALPPLQLRPDVLAVAASQFGLGGYFHSVTVRFPLPYFYSKGHISREISGNLKSI